MVRSLDWRASEDDGREEIGGDGGWLSTNKSPNVNILCIVKTSFVLPHVMVQAICGENIPPESWEPGCVCKHGYLGKASMLPREHIK